MDEKLMEELYAGEKVLWSGAPEDFVDLDVTNKQAIIKRGILIFGVMVALCVLYTVYVISKGIALKPALIVIALAIAVGGTFSYTSECKKLRRMKYLITDKRIIYMVDQPKSLEYAKISGVDLKTDADGHKSFLFGYNAIKAKEYAWRSLAVADPYIDENTGLCSRFVMYAVPDAENVKKILSEYISF